MAGVIEALAKNLPPDERKWTVLGGVSAGSVTLAELMMFPIGQEIEASEYTRDLWKGIRSKDIYSSWGKGLIYAFFKSHSLLNTDPLLDFMMKILKDRTMQRHFTISMGNLNKGWVNVVSDLNSTYWKDIAYYIVVSSSIPAIF